MCRILLCDAGYDSSETWDGMEGCFSVMLCKHFLCAGGAGWRDGYIDLECDLDMLYCNEIKWVKIVKCVVNT